MREWSKYQQAIFQDCATGKGNTLIQARAGTGKTTTIVEGMKHVAVGLRVLFCAFNKTIQLELANLAPKSADVKTIHSLGLSMFRKRFPKLRVDDSKGRKMAELALENSGIQYTRETITRVMKIASLGKSTLEKDLEVLAGEYGLDDDDLPAKKMAPIASEAIRLSTIHTDTIDFDDMVFLPCHFEMSSRIYDVVFVDETQDLNASQLYLVRGLVKPDGRIIVVGDDRQAIYGFRGASEDAMETMRQVLNAKVLPLSITYRCPKSIVDLARTIVPDYEAAPEAPQGKIEMIELHTCLENAKPGDFVLSRKNAPLMSTCLSLLKRGVPATIQGRDIGNALISLLERSKKTDLDSAFEWLENWKEKQVERLTKQGKETQAEAILDQVEALYAIAEGETTVSAVARKIEKLFSDDAPTSKVICSTVHKAKGLERPRVFVLESTFRRGKGREEENLYYVAITRAKSELYLVSTKV